MEEEKEKLEGDRLKVNKNDLLKNIGIAIAMILLIVSLWSLYMSLGNLIGIWVAEKYAPIYRALMNLAVVILALYTIKLLIKKE
ncbi:MAG: hypothetical protein R6U44_09495 [Archaeoglobaceae archaeon]